MHSKWNNCIRNYKYNSLLNNKSTLTIYVSVYLSVRKIDACALYLNSRLHTHAKQRKWIKEVKKNKKGMDAHSICWLKRNKKQLTIKDEYHRRTHDHNRGGTYFSRLIEIYVEYILYHHMEWIFFQVELAINLTIDVFNQDYIKYMECLW